MLFCIMHDICEVRATWKPQAARWRGKDSK